MSIEISAKLSKQIDELVKHFVDNEHLFVTTLENLESHLKSSPTLKKLIHSSKYRTKDPLHLKDKLHRRAKDLLSKNEQFDVTSENLFSKINDLGGYRILHLHTTQFEQINSELLKIFDEYNWKLFEEPEAKTWDDEYREYFERIGIKTVKNKNLYTSVHYVLQASSRSGITCELQVRTLMEEVWGETDHQINYPHKTSIHSCREQIKTLARVTSGCTRLVDSIFSTYDHHENNIASADKVKKNGYEEKIKPSQPKPVQKKSNKKFGKTLGTGKGKVAKKK